ncbi:MAG: hypothetical protein ABSG03_42500, partial [Bryobacteraceae bacterium]
PAPPARQNFQSPGSSRSTDCLNIGDPAITKRVDRPTRDHMAKPATAHCAFVVVGYAELPG